MIVGVIGSGSIGPDLAYGFVSAIAKEGGKVYLNDIRQEALDAGMARIQGYVVLLEDDDLIGPELGGDGLADIGRGEVDAVVRGRELGQELRHQRGTVPEEEQEHLVVGGRGHALRAANGGADRLVFCSLRAGGAAEPPAAAGGACGTGGGIGGDALTRGLWFSHVSDARTYVPRPKASSTGRVPCPAAAALRALRRGSRICCRSARSPGR